jgi:hypothetical protein
MQIPMVSGVAEHWRNPADSSVRANSAGCRKVLMERGR